MSSRAQAEGKNVKYKVNGFNVGGHPVNIEFDRLAMQGKLSLHNLNCWVRSFVAQYGDKAHITYEIWGEDRGHWEFLSQHKMLGTRSIRSERDTFLVTEELLRRLGPEGAGVCKSAAFRQVQKRATKSTNKKCTDEGSQNSDDSCEKPAPKAQVVKPESRLKPEESKYH